MSEPKVTAAHLRHAAVVRQSSMAQVSRNRESTTRQYNLVARAVALGWPRAAVQVIDEDLGISGASRMTDTLIADTDGLYHPGFFIDRMLLGT